MAKSRAAPKQLIQKEPSEQVFKLVAGVVGGDSACIRACVRDWTGRPSAAALSGVKKFTRLPNYKKQRDLIVLCEPSFHFDPWPGGPLIWLYPERGPSEPELAQMRTALNTNEAAAPQLKILICLPHHMELSAASADLDRIADTLRWAVDPGVEMEIEAVWLSGSRESTLSTWFSNLE